jgi:ParB family chromosome partitioning protein
VNIVLDWIRLEQLEPHPHNPRRELGDVTELAASITAHGVLEPVVVAPGPSGGVYRLIAGHRRVKAAGQAGLDVVPALVRGDLDSDNVQLEAMLVENLHRADLSPMEEADAYSQLKLDFGYGRADIAAATGRSKATVDQRLALKKLPEHLQDKVHTHQLSLADAAVMVEFAGDAKALTELQMTAGTHNFSFTVNRMRQQRERAKEHAAAVKQAREAGDTVVDAAGLQEGWRWSSRPGGCSLEALQLDPPAFAAHATSCEHHALVDTDFGLVPACLNPASHLPAGLGVPVPADAEAAREGSARDAEERQAAAAKLREDLAAAATCRADFLQELVRAKKPTTAVLSEMLAEVLRAHLLGDMETDPAGLAELLDVTVPDAGDGEEPYDLALRTLSGQIDRWTLTRLVQATYAAALVLDSPDRERSLSEPWRVGSYTSGVARGYLNHLRHLGYTPCEVEQRLLAVDAGAAEMAST